MSFAAMIAPQATFNPILWEGLLRVEGPLKYKWPRGPPTYREGLTRIHLYFYTKLI